MPEQAQTHQTGFIGWVQATLAHLNHHDDDPDQTGGYVQTVSTHQRKEAGEERTAVWAVTFGDQVMEFIDLHRHEADAKQEGQEQPGVNAAYLALVHADHRHTVGDGAEQQEESFNQYKI
ncbi:hypothetical protein D3C79_865050 [compost metagenome]